jgi:ribosome-associated toxin RatA of RatAB toxin-antitoxin module
MKLTKTRLKEIIREELLNEGRDTLIKKQSVKTPFGNLKFEVWEITTGPGKPAMLSFDVEFNGTNIQDTTIEGESGGMAEVRHTMRAKKVKFK